MIFVYLVARFLYREQAALNAIGMAALILLVLRPAWLFESGFQLSFASVLLIAGLAVPILERTTEPYRRALRDLDNVERDAAFSPRLAQFRLDIRWLIAALTRRQSLLRRHPALALPLIMGPARIGLWTINVLLFSAIIQLGLLLPMAETFHRVTYAGIGLNALATPLVTLLLGVAVPTVILGATVPALAVWPAKLLAIVTRGFLLLTDLPNLPHWLSYRVPEPPVWVSWGFALAIVAAAMALARHRRTFWVSLVAASIFGAFISLHPFSPRLPRGALEVTALDCGGGDALFVVLPDRTTMLVDGGGTRLGSGREGAFRGRRWEPGEDIVSPYLWSRGIKRIDVVALSHAHEDHLGGLAAVVRNFRIGEFWHGVNPPTPAYQAILAEVRRRGIPMRQLATGDRIPLGGTSVEILWPAAGHAVSTRPSNDDSVVMRIAGAGATALLPGDISEEVEQELVRSGVTLDSRLLKVAHHGGRSSSSATFLSRVSPSIVLVTAEGGNPTNLPDPEVLARLRAAGARTYRTDMDGAVTVEMKGSQLSVRTYRTSPAD
jgi:competence protein ComEC